MPKKVKTPPACSLADDGSFRLRGDLESERFNHGGQRLLLRAVTLDRESGQFSVGTVNVTNSLSEAQRAMFIDAE